MNSRKNKYIIIILFIGVLCLTFFCFSNKKNIGLNKETFNTNNKVNKNMFAIMIENEDGTGYERSDTFPEDLFLNKDLSGCVDGNGTLIKGLITYVGGIVNVDAESTVYCYLYFDSTPDNDEPITIVVSTDDITNSIPTNGIYNGNVHCDKGNIAYNRKYQRIEIGGFSNKSNCTLDYIKDTASYTKLSTIVQNANPTNNNGYRYSGKSPNNYVWFNDELWRIIGLIPTCTVASDGVCSTRVNLVKIIRENSLGGIAFDLKKENECSNTWGTNSLYTLLNDYYYGALNGTNTPYCGNLSGGGNNCDYRVKGIDPNGYYAKMIESVYFNIGAFSSYSGHTASGLYSAEIATVSPRKGKIGLMTGSDYGYAASPSVVTYTSTTMYNYANTEISSQLWLFYGAYEWTQTSSKFGGYDSSMKTAMALLNGGAIDGYDVDGNIIVRPAVHLNDNVYVISGTGKESDPYIIGME